MTSRETTSIIAGQEVAVLTWLNLVFNTAADLGEDFAEIVG
jgi:hypothetical protein